MRLFKNLLGSPLIFFRASIFLPSFREIRRLFFRAGALVGDAGHHEEEIGEAIEIGQGVFVDRRLAGERDDRSFGAARDGAGQMQCGAQLSSARQNEFAQRLQFFEQQVDQPLHLGHAFFDDPRYLNLQRAGQVSAPAAHCRVAATSQPDHRERPPFRQTHTTWAAKSAARCLSSGAQQWHANCGVWHSN